MVPEPIDPTRKRILDGALEQFLELGFSKTTMDELAEHLGMSKRTLYQHFSSKHELFESCIRERLETVAAGLDRILDRPDLDSLGKLNQVSLFMVASIPRPSRRFIEDASRNLPEIWERIRVARREILQSRFRRLFLEGKAEGLFQPNLEPEFVLRILLALIEDLINPRALSELPFTTAETLDRIIRVVLFGILSDDARFRTQLGTWLPGAI